MWGQAPGVTQIGRYQILDRIAAGGMAELYLARFVGPGGFEKRCAIKRVLPQFSSDSTFARMFLNEARITALFDHPNIVQVFDMGQDDEGRFFIVMEHVDGLNLRQILRLCQERRRTVPPELAAWIMTQALGGLAYAHDFREASGERLNLVHRDVSPQNIIVSREGAVKVVDFGIAKASSIRAQTVAGMLKGKLGYMSPEQAQGDPLDARSDLFCAGICLYELITGERPFVGDDDFGTLKAILDSPPPPLSGRTPECPLTLEAAVYRALEKNPGDRFQTARAFEIELQQILRHAATPLASHVLADFMASLSTPDARPFDAARVRIREPADSAGVRSARRSVRPSQTPYFGDSSHPPVTEALVPSNDPSSGASPLVPMLAATVVVDAGGPTPAPSVAHHLSELTDEAAHADSFLALAAKVLRSRPFSSPIVWFAFSFALGTIALATWAIFRPAPPVVIEPLRASEGAVEPPPLGAVPEDEPDSTQEATAAVAAVPPPETRSKRPEAVSPSTGGKGATVLSKPVSQANRKKAAPRPDGPRHRKKRR